MPHAVDYAEELALIELSRLQRAAMAYVPRKKQPEAEATKR